MSSICCLFMNVFAEKALECLSLLVKKFTPSKIPSRRLPWTRPRPETHQGRVETGRGSVGPRRKPVTELSKEPSETRRGAVENPRTLEPHPTMLKNWVPDGFGQVPPDGRAGIVRCCSEMHQIYATDFAPHSRADSEYVRVCATVYIYIYIHTHGIFMYEATLDLDR